MAAKCFSPGAIGLIILYLFLQSNDSSNSTVLPNTIPQEEQIGQLVIDENEHNEKEAETHHEQPVIVDVKGAVKFSGVYELTTEHRIIDAIQLAGGYTDEAETRYINHAQKLQDEMIIYIPKKGEDMEQISLVGQAVQSTVPNSTVEKSKVNINTADETELSTLPGVGPSKAQAIISYRDENGSFQTIDDLKNVSGIGDKTFEKLKEFIIVK